MTFDKSWWTKARCWGAAPEHIDFFPNKESRDKIEKLKAFCQPCPVRVQCLRGAVERNEESGVWGGFEAKEIRKLVSARDKAAA